MIDGGFIETLSEKLPRPMVVKVNGVEKLCLPHTDSSGTAYEVETLYEPECTPAAVQLSTLTGLVDYLTANRDELPLGELLVHVAGHGRVEVRGKLQQPFAQRFAYAVATIDDVLEQGFRFGQFYDHETFLVGLQALFVSTPTREDVLRLCSSLKDGTVSTFDDDGVSQAVTAKAGVVRVSTVPVPNPVRLVPFRTFREVEQPESPFVLRMRSGDAQPTIALFEADDGAWKLEAIQRVAAFLREKLPAGIAIVA